MRQIAIMQGRLLPKWKGRYQAFPLKHWQAEFYIAAEFGFQNIEFILDYNDYNTNPLMSKNGIEAIKFHSRETNVGVRSICADYFMDAPLHVEDNRQSLLVLNELIENAALLQVKDIVIPCVDKSSLKNAAEKKALVLALQAPLRFAEKHAINLNLETDLPPKAFHELLIAIDSPNIKVNYDSGNSASLGFNIEEEFEIYGDYISDLHIKDRILNGGSVFLGTGNTNFDKLFSLLKSLKFNGNITLQASRANDFLTDIQNVKAQLTFTQQYIKKYLS